MVYLLRHTKPHIKGGICYGQTDLELDADFHNIHLPLVISKIKQLDIKKIYTSPLIRCKGLAQSLSKELNIEPPTEDGLLMEMNFGDWELLNWDKIYNSPEGKAWFGNFLENRCPGGESFQDVVTRAYQFINKHKDLEKSLIVTHAGFIRAFAVVNNKIDINNPFSLQIEYGDIIQYYINEDA